MSITRQLALRMVDHARRMMPDERAGWADGMVHELHHIANDREALAWAFGCATTAYAARLRADSELAPRGVRLLLAAWCVITPLLFIYRAALFSMCPFFTSPECQATLNPVPFALHSIANGLYLLAALYLVRNRGAFRPYMAGFLFIMASEVYAELLSQRGVIFSTIRTAYDFTMSDLGHFRPPGGYPVTLLMTTLVLPLMLGLAIWLMDRYRESAEVAPAKD